MDDFQYRQPADLEEACALLDEFGSDGVVLSGGQSLLPMLRLRLAAPACVIDINGLDGHDHIRAVDGELRIGCLARYTAIERSAAVAERCRVLGEAVSGIGDPQVRNRGTLCGSIAHADPAGDPPVVATLLGGTARAVSSAGERSLDLGSFVEGPFQTALAADELLVELRLPVVEAPTGAAYESWEPSEGAYPVAACGATVTLEDGTVTDASVVTGAVGAGPARMDEAAAYLGGREPDEETLAEASARVGEAVEPVDDAEGSPTFKSHLTETLANRALATAVDRAGGAA